MTTAFILFQNQKEQGIPSQKGRARMAHSDMQNIMYTQRGQSSAGFGMGSSTTSLLMAELSADLDNGGSSVEQAQQQQPFDARFVNPPPALQGQGHAHAPATHPPSMTAFSLNKPVLVSSPDGTALPQGIVVSPNSPSHDRQQPPPSQLPPRRRKVPAQKRAISANVTSTDTTTSSTEAKKRKHKSGWRKPSDKPKRPLSAYNIFFQHEREKIVAAAESTNGNGVVLSVATETQGVSPDAIATAVYAGVDSGPKVHKGVPRSVVANSAGSAAPNVASTVQTLQKIILRSRGQTKASSDKLKSTRAHTKTHGKISFVDLAKTVAKKWKELDPASKAVYVALADVERGLYRKKVEVWERKKKAEAEAAAPPSAQIVDPAAAAAVATPAAILEKKAESDREDRMRRILENSSRHGSVYNDSMHGDDVLDVFPNDPSAQQAPTNASSSEPSASDIASFIYGQIRQGQVEKATASSNDNQVLPPPLLPQQQQQLIQSNGMQGICDAAMASRLSRMMRKAGGQRKSQKPKIAAPPTACTITKNTQMPPAENDAGGVIASPFTIGSPHVPSAPTNIIAKPDQSSLFNKERISRADNKLDNINSRAQGNNDLKLYSQQDNATNGMLLQHEAHSIDDMFLDLVDHADLSAALGTLPGVSRQQDPQPQSYQHTSLGHSFSMPLPSEHGTGSIAADAFTSASLYGPIQLAPPTPIPSQHQDHHHHQQSHNNHINISTSDQGLDEFLKWAFENNGMD